MNKGLKKCLTLILGIFILSGCAGYDRILFVTKTNVGLDIDDTPPTAEISIARREVAIAPSYQDTVGMISESVDHTLPLLGSFGLTGGVFNPAISSVFSGGDAAVILVEDNHEGHSSHALCLTEYPDARSPIKKVWHWITRTDKEEVTRTRAFYFATDTSFGVKVGWNGTGGPYPTSLKLGYNRSEFASPPVHITEKKCGHLSIQDNEDLSTQDKPSTWEVRVPSFFASLNNRSNFITLPGDASQETGVTNDQFFATGTAGKA